MTTQCIIIRCKSVGKDEMALFAVLKESFSERDIFFSCDSEFDDHSNQYSLKNFVAKSELNVDVPTLGWRCGDHNFYSVYSKNEHYDYYWIIEPDVYLETNGLSALLDEVKNKSTDILIHGLTKQNPSWSWYNRYKSLFPQDEIYGGLFALVRLSNNAVSFLYDKRVELAKHWSENTFPAQNYPNDEAFVCSTLMNNGFTGDSFSITKNGYFNLCRKHISNVPQGVIAHPVYSNYGRIIEKEKQTLLASKNASTTALSATMTKLLEQNNYDPELLTNLLNVVIEAQ